MRGRGRRRRRPALAVLPMAASVLMVCGSTTAQEDRYEALIEASLWSGDQSEGMRAARSLRERVDLTDVSREEFQAFESALARGRSNLPRPEAENGAFAVETLSVSLPDGRQMPVGVFLPKGYDPSRPWPMLLAMHGGPVADPRQALLGADRMLSVWLEPANDAGWIVVSPAMTHVVARAPRTEERLPYEILTVDQMEGVLREVFSRYRVDPERIVSTGISLGSNFSIAYAASRPDRFAAIVPVSTEGESREALLRNLLHVPVYVLEGARDRNIRDIRGPRALADILKRWNYDIVYREFAERAHEGFQDLYPDVLQWLDNRPRPRYPKSIVRVPHAGIVPLATRVHWIEADTRQAVVRASVAGQRIEIEARWARTLDVFLHDELVDLDRPVAIRLNGEPVFEGKLARSIELALEDVRERLDPGRPYAARVRVSVPVNGSSLESAVRLTKSLEPERPEGVLSFWEMYAVRSLEERFPTLGFRGEPVPDPAAIGLTGELTAIRVRDVDPSVGFGESGLRPGDVLLEVGGEPFFRGRDLAELHHWLVRELSSVPRTYVLDVLRDGVAMELSAELALGNYLANP